LDQINLEETVRKEIAKTKRLIAEYKEFTQPIAPDDAIGRITRMDAINNKSVMEASLRQAEQKLEKLHLVIQKIGTKEFGICQHCGKEIAIQRIIQRPESLLCVNCAT
jgi:DnaK suppressor protein